MTLARKLFTTVAGSAMATGSAFAQVPDMLNALDAGGRSMGLGGSQYATSADTFSTIKNPAGLAYIQRPTFGFATTTLPTNRTRVSGSLTNKVLDTRSRSGDYTLSHIALAYPLGSGDRVRGTIGIGYTLGGWFHDTQRGSNLSGGISQFFDFTRVRTGFTTLSYGTTSGKDNLAIGAGLVVATQDIKNDQVVQFSDTQVPPAEADATGSGTGFGVVVGLLYTPAGQPNSSFGISVRTPISIDANSQVMRLYDRIPGVVSGGVAYRRDDVGRANDFIVFGAQVNYFFGGRAGERLDRDAFAAGGVGFEYHYSLGSASIPVRVGYRWAPAGGDPFDDRNGLTYGLGYRPGNRDWSFDINWAQADRGGVDTAIYLTYRFGR